MDGLVVVVVVVVCIVLVAREVIGPGQPAMNRPIPRRGEAGSPPPPALGPPSSWPAPTGRPIVLPVLEPADVTIDPVPAPSQEAAGTRWWQRLRSAVVLGILAVVLGAALAVVVGVGAVLLVSLLRSGVT